VYDSVLNFKPIYFLKEKKRTKLIDYLIYNTFFHKIGLSRKFSEFLVDLQAQSTTLRRVTGPSPFTKFNKKKQNSFEKIKSKP